MTTDVSISTEDQIIQKGKIKFFFKKGGRNVIALNKVKGKKKRR